VNVAIETSPALPPTPGRWFVDEGIYGPERSRWILAENADGTRYLLAIVFSHEKETAELTTPPGHRDANAAVMAAAKELAAALALVVDQVAKCQPIDDHGHRFAMNASVHSAQQLLAALPPFTTLQGEI
jgi:hypothetical protein